MWDLIVLVPDQCLAFYFANPGLRIPRPDAPSMLLQDEFEMVQKRAARFVTGNNTGLYNWEYDWYSKTAKAGISEKKEER